MPDQLDTEIRALVREIVDSSPPAPAFESIEAALFVPAARPRVMRRPRVVVIAACVVIALVIGAVLLFARNEGPSVESPARPPTTGATRSACAGKAYVSSEGDDTRGDRHGHGRGGGGPHRGRRGACRSGYHS